MPITYRPIKQLLYSPCFHGIVTILVLKSLITVTYPSAADKADL